MKIRTPLDLKNISEAENRARCNYRFFGNLPFDGPFAIIDEHNPYCQLFARMRSSYQKEFQEGKRGDKKLKEMDDFLERMLKRKCTKQEFENWLNLAKWRVNLGREDNYLRQQYLENFPEL